MTSVEPIPSVRKKGTCAVSFSATIRGARSGNKRQAVAIGIALALITMSNMKILIARGLDDPIAYLGYGIILVIILRTLSTVDRSVRRKSLFFAAVCGALLCIGIAMQPMDISLKIRLIVTVLIFDAIAVLADAVIVDFAGLRIASYGVFLGIVVAAGLTMLFGGSVVSVINEGSGFFGEWGLNCGLSHKNYFAMMLFASFSCLSICAVNAKLQPMDILIMMVELVLIYLSHARIVWLLLLLFSLVLLMSRFRVLGGNISGVAAAIIAIAVGLVIFFCIQWVFTNYISKSMTYMARFNGLMNWFRYCSDDWMRLLFGDAASFFGTAESYYDNFRTLTGKSGAVDMAVLNIMIKTGFIGLFGYVLVFARMIFCAVRSENKKIRIAIFAILLPLIVSMFSENCVSTISISYVTLCCLALSGLCGMAARERTNQGMVQRADASSRLARGVSRSPLQCAALSVTAWLHRRFLDEAPLA